MRSSISVTATLLLLLAVASGCSAVTLRTGFTPEPGSTNAGDRISRLKVSGTADARPLQGRSSLGPGFFAVIPLVPYGHQRISPGFGVMSSSLSTGSFLSDLVEVVIEDLRIAGVAKQVLGESVNLRNLGPDGEKEISPYELRLILDEGLYHRNMTLYGVSLAGAFLWMVGFPTSYGSADLAISAELLDPAGRSLGKQSFEIRESVTEWLYYPLPTAYSRAMARAYGQISPQLRDFVATTLAR